MTQIKIPLNPFRAVYKAVSTEETRYYLCGVHVQDDCLAATDGHILLRYKLDAGTLTGVGDAPFTLKVDVNEKAMKPKHSERAYMHVDLERLIIEVYLYTDGGEVSERVGVCAFEVIDGSFPDYERVIPDNSGAFDSVDFCFNAGYIRTFADASKVMGVEPTLKLVTGPTGASPANVLFSGVPNLDGVIMPTRPSAF